MVPHLICNLGTRQGVARVVNFFFPERTLRCHELDML